MFRAGWSVGSPFTVDLARWSGLEHEPAASSLDDMWKHSGEATPRANQIGSAGRARNSIKARSHRPECLPPGTRNALQSLLVSSETVYYPPVSFAWRLVKRVERQRRPQLPTRSHAGRLELIDQTRAQQTLPFCRISRWRHSKLEPQGRPQQSEHLAAAASPSAA